MRVGDVAACEGLARVFFPLLGQCPTFAVQWILTDPNSTQSEEGPQNSCEYIKVAIWICEGSHHVASCLRFWTGDCPLRVKNKLFLLSQLTCTIGSINFEL